MHPNHDKCYKNNYHRHFSLSRAEIRPINRYGKLGAILRIYSLPTVNKYITKNFNIHLTLESYRLNSRLLKVIIVNYNLVQLIFQCRPFLFLLINGKRQLGLSAAWVQSRPNITSTSAWTVPTISCSALHLLIKKWDYIHTIFRRPTYLKNSTQL